MQSLNDQSWLAVIANASDGTLRTWHIDGAGLTPEQCLPAGNTPMPLASGAGGSLFVHTRGGQRTICHFSRRPQSGYTQPPGIVPVDNDLVYIAVSPDERYLYGVSYVTNQVIVYDLHALKRGECRLVTTADGIAHAHCVALSPDGRFVYVSSLSRGCIEILRWEGATLVPSGSLFIAKDFGPRHLRIHPASGMLYAISEFQGNIAAFTIDTQSGGLALAALPERPAALSHLHTGFPRPGVTDKVQPNPAVLATLCWASEIQVSADGAFIYTAERTSGRILVWKKQDNGELTNIFWVETDPQPRSIQLTPCGTWLLSCSEKTPRITLWRINRRSGELQLHTQYNGGTGANYIEIVPW
ncbi:hypothetical protein DT73_10690 [Mangrovibacter sp. MFB070]|uniref:lactonase family protein n=1 Tax=Mangrovibacter sp. MFB070 TaxID=1224318 RepID=UPI0004D860BF|nr:beta-propeller fold lactonase family protein [Mangrovibacter sp. MFB070]KEA52571.1 hypothetical protein DT73_10690 [Mangrovibacter sp. MFB070]